MNNQYLSRIIKACKLDANLYEEVEADKSATFQAAGVVVLSSLAAGVGALSLGTSNFLIAPLLSLVSWFVWAYLVYFIGAKIFPESTTEADHGQLLRTIGFSSAPGLIRVFGIIPNLTSVVFIIASIWMLVAMVIAVRQALDYKSTWRSVGVVVTAFFIQSIILITILKLF
tara:strand:+ start:395 stop:907 length:513 start_codon:yes stop_codon:yes gene_type:complete